MSNFIDGMNQFLSMFNNSTVDNIVNFLGFSIIPVLVILVVIAIACVTSD